ncbi:MAG: hypothetical protein AAFX78_18340 [Cyanobacteria bacterium J06638_20]
MTKARSQNSPELPLVLESRDRYRSCHVVLSDTGERLAAIQFDGNYYSFFRSVTEKQRALELSRKLQNRGDSVVITKTPKGFVLWVLETTATPAKSKAKASKKSKADTPYRLLTSPNDCQPCQITVPDLDKQLAAVRYNGKLYSLFKTVETLQQANQIIKRLSYQGDETIILQTTEGFSLLILEPDAVMVR